MYNGILEEISNIKYIPPINTAHVIADDFEIWVCRQLEKKLNFQLVDCSKDKLLLKYGFNNKVLFNSIDELFHNELVLNMRNMLDDDKRLSYKIHTKFKKLILFQPWSQQTPDILIISDNNLFPIECKTSNKGRYVFSNSIPKDGYHFMLANLKRNVIRYSLGKNIEYPLKDPEIQKIYNDYMTKGKQLTKKINSMIFNWDEMKIKFSPHIRCSFKPTREII